MHEYKSNKQVLKWGILLLLTGILIFLPLFLKPKGEFTGSDDKAKNVIKEINKEYTPWFKPIWEPPSKDVESLLFTLQACTGVFIISFYLGYLYGKSKKK